MNITGSNGIINPIVMIVATVMILGGFIFRKVVANESLNVPFSLIGSCAGGILSFVLVYNIFHTIRWAVLVALIVYFGLGFLIGDAMGDGESKE